MFIIAAALQDFLLFLPDMWTADRVYNDGNADFVAPMGPPAASDSQDKFPPVRFASAVESA